MILNRIYFGVLTRKNAPSKRATPSLELMSECSELPHHAQREHSGCCFSQLHVVGSMPVALSLLSEHLEEGLALHSLVAVPAPYGHAQIDI